MSSFHVLQPYTSHVLLGSVKTRLQQLPAGGRSCPAWRALHSPGSFSRAVCSQHSKALAQCEQTGPHLRICEGRAQVLPLLQNKKIRWVVFALSQQQLSSTTMKCRALVPGSLWSRKKTGAAAGKPGHRSKAGKAGQPSWQCSQSSPSLTTHRYEREKESSFWCCEMGRFKERQDRFGAFQGNLP